METKDLITTVKDLNSNIIYAIDSDIIVDYSTDSSLMTTDYFEQILIALTESKDVVVSIDKEKLYIELETPQRLKPLLRMFATFDFNVEVTEKGEVVCCCFINRLRKTK